MSLAKFRRVYGKNGSGRFVVSEGVAPSAYILAHPGLPTLWYDIEDPRFEIVMPKGTIMSVVADSNGDSRVVPANGTASSFTWGDGQVTSYTFPDGQSTGRITGATPTDGSGTNTDTVTVPARSVPIGCAQYDVLRPFDKGTSQGAGWITSSYVEWPIVNGINANLAVGDLIRSDAYGRPVKCAATDLYNSSAVYSYLAVGRVVEVEKFATNFDDGLLSYMQLPSDPGALKEVYALTRNGDYNGKLGIRANLDVANVVGAVRVSLTIA
jgi:hypothetical protein